jgi:hypothetical protein
MPRSQREHCSCAAPADGFSRVKCLLLRIALPHCWLATVSNDRVCRTAAELLLLRLLLLLLLLLPVLLLPMLPLLLLLLLLVAAGCCLCCLYCFC